MAFVWLDTILAPLQQTGKTNHDYESVRVAAPVGKSRDPAQSGGVSVVASIVLGSWNHLMPRIEIASYFSSTILFVSRERAVTKR